MDAVVLVGGFGTRLQPLTLETPKQMLPLGHGTMLDSVIAHLGAHGVTRAVLSLGFRPEIFRSAYPDAHCAGVELAYAVEPEPLDTAGAIRYAADTACVDATFVAVNGDVITSLDIGAQLAYHREVDALATIHLVPVDDPSRYGVVTTAADGRVLGFVEKPPIDLVPSRWVNAGTYILEPHVLERIPRRPTSIERETFPALAAEGRLYGHQADVYWLDAGTPGAYLGANLDLLSGRAGTVIDPVAGDAEVAPDATIDESVITSAVVVEAAALVRRSLVSPGATIGAGAVVTDSIVGAGATVGPGAQVSAGSIVGPDAVVLPRETVTGAERVTATP